MRFLSFHYSILYSDSWNRIAAVAHQPVPSIRSTDTSLLLPIQALEKKMPGLERSSVKMVQFIAVEAVMTALFHELPSAHT